MSRSLIRLSLWALLALLLLALGIETMDDGALKSQLGRALPIALTVTLLLLATALLLQLMERLFGGPSAARCATCRKRVPKGDIYCREHLRAIVLEEADREHEAQ